MITAKEAHLLAETRRLENAWDKLFERIEKEANNGNFTLIFDEEIENVFFEEHRKEVKKKLEDLGYEVSYSRMKDQDFYYGGYCFHNKYAISWRGCSKCD